MKNGFSISKFKLSLALVLLLSSLSGYAQNQNPFSINESPLPAPTAPVNDFAGVLDEQTQQTLNRRLIELRDKTNPQVELAVAIVKTTGERPIFDYSLAVSRGWKIGSKADDNPSLLLFVAVDDRKAYAQVSKDLEDELPDALVTSIQRQYLVPAFRQNNYGKGISDTLEAYIRVIESKQTGEPVTGTTEQPNGRGEKSGGGLGGTMTCLIILFVLLIIIFSRFGSGGRGGRGGGGFGGGTGGALPWIIGSVVANSLGNSGNSSGGWGGGGSSSGGGDSWGGFGGGGDFGGGGGGSDW